MSTPCLRSGARALLRALPAAAIACAIMGATHTASAAGFFVTDRGVRPMGRAGAFVAGADDLHAIWYNPAGLSEAGRSFLFDGSFVIFNNRYARRACAEPDCVNTTVDVGVVNASSVPLPLPTLAFSHNFGLKDWNFAVGLYAPNAVIPSYPSEKDAPQRYSLITLDGSILAIGGLFASWKPHPKFSMGLGFQALFGTFSSRLALSACPATITCAPENPDWDALAQLSVGPIFAPSGSIGFRYQPVPAVVIGISGQLPFWVSAPASLQVRLPSAPFFEGATVNGTNAGVAFTLAPIVRAGVEVRPDPFDRIELAFVFEGWGMHDKIALSPNNVSITNVRAVGTYQVGNVDLVRNFQNTYSVRLGYERIQPFKNGWSFAPRAGVSFETSATAPEYTSVLTMDTMKTLITVGAGLGKDRWRFDLTGAFMIPIAVDVAPADAKIYQVRPFRTSPDTVEHAINGGRYDMSTFVIGLGLKYAF